MFEGEAEAWLGIDLGTQSVRALLVTADGTVLGGGSAPLTGRREGVRHEQDPGSGGRRCARRPGPRSPHRLREGRSAASRCAAPPARSC